jgi:DNA-binding NarL/FixJ family response regulator
MPATPILTVTNDDTFLALLRTKLRDQLGPKGRIMVAASVDEACPLLKTARARLIVVHLAGDSGRYEQLDRLLWTTSVLSRPTPVVVIAERYRTDQATTMYRMGVSEYISRTHHLDQLGDVLGAYLRPVTLSAVATAESDASAKIWRANHSASSRTAQVV